MFCFSYIGTSNDGNKISDIICVFVAEPESSKPLISKPIIGHVVKPAPSTSNPHVVLLRILSIYLSIYITIYGSTTLVDLGCFFSLLILYTVGRTPWPGDQPVARPQSTRRRTQTQNKHRHPCLEWDSNPRSQCSSGRNGSCLRPRGHCDRSP
jgi:hypothetical protein